MKMEYLVVSAGVLIAAIAVITPGPLMGAGSHPLTFPGFIFGVCLMLSGIGVVFLRRSRKQKRGSN